MKKTFLLLALALAVVQVSRAQDAEIEDRSGNTTMREWRMRDLADRGFLNFSYVTQRMIEPVTGLKGPTSDIGGALSMGRNFVLHRRPILGLGFVGLNVAWFDANYAMYKADVETGIDPVDDFVDDLDVQMHQLDLSVGIGPSISIQPIAKLGVQVYGRYHPGYGAIAGRMGKEWSHVIGGVVHGVVAGGAVSWGSIALGVEARWGTGNYKLLSKDETYLDEEGKFKTSGMRAYLSLRF